MSLSSCKRSIPFLFLAAALATLPACGDDDDSSGTAAGLSTPPPITLPAAVKQRTRLPS